MEAVSFTRRYINITKNGVRLHAVEAGPADGPLVVLLHGFPEFWYGWRHQIAPLARQGYRVLVPDQRGYNRSTKPSHVRAYTLDVLADDVLGLIDAAGRERAAIIGHDWGGAVAWHLAEHFPDRVRRLGVLNVPHPQVMQQTLLRSPAQLLRSWHIFFFQLPALPEALLGWRDGWLGAQMLRASCRPGTFSESDLRRYRTAWMRPHALRSMLHWYRAAARYGRPRPRPVITVPTLIIWGTRDAALQSSMAAASINLCTDGQLVLIDEASHWVQHEEAERVNALLVDFLRT